MKKSRGGSVGNGEGGGDEGVMGVMGVMGAIGSRRVAMDDGVVGVLV